MRGGLPQAGYQGRDRDPSIPILGVVSGGALQTQRRSRCKAAVGRQELDGRRLGRVL